MFFWAEARTRVGAMALIGTGAVFGMQATSAFADQAGLPMAGWLSLKRSPQGISLSSPMAPGCLRAQRRRPMARTYSMSAALFAKENLAKGSIDSLC